jgi:hypothetical protein
MVFLSRRNGSTRRHGTKERKEKKIYNLLVDGAHILGFRNVFFPKRNRFFFEREMVFLSERNGFFSERNVFFSKGNGISFREK